MGQWFGIACSLGALGAAGSVAAQQSETYEYDELGRLIVAEEASGDARSWCFDEAGNRLEFKLSNTGALANCATPPVQALPDDPTPTPTPTPPPSTNNPPVANNDTVTGQCFSTVTVNVTANDSDVEDKPAKPVLVSVGGGSGGMAGAMKASDSSVWVDFDSEGDITQFTYTIRDSAGATDTGQLTVATTYCGGGGGLIP